MLRKPASKAIVLQMPARSNGTDPQPPDSPRSLTGTRMTNMLQITRDKLTFAWLRGSTELRLAEAYQIPRGAVEEIVRQTMVERLNRRAA